MERHYPRFLLVTQNVDNLHERAGSERMLKIHGSLMEHRCTTCERISPVEIPADLAEIAAERLPQCRCGDLQRPNVVWFGEYLNPRHLEEIEAFFQEAGRRPAGDMVVLVIGTSGAVSRGYGITLRARHAEAHVVEINPEASMLSEDVDLALRSPAGEALGRIWQEVTR
jgi:NAD-dependent deacetylase